MRKIVFVDMDDTICDFITPYNKALQVNPSIKYPQSQYGFFANLEPITNALHYMNVMNDHYFDVYILTRPSILNPLCYTEKRVWVEKHLGIQWCNKLILCPDKSLLNGDYLIDDVLWPRFKGKQLQFGTEQFPNWYSVYNELLRLEGYEES